MAKTALKIAITTGDIDGIGLEVATKSLAKLGPQAGAHFILWRSPKGSKRDLKYVQGKFKVITFDSPEKALEFFLSPAMNPKTLVEISSVKSPALWVEQTAQWCVSKKIHSMVTGPISKTEIYKAGLKDMGHTDILKRVSSTNKVHMSFLGGEFNVVLATAHIPVSSVASQLNASAIIDAAMAANNLRQSLRKTTRQKPIAILGLNPHAGEEGLIGSEETQYFQEVLKTLSAKKIHAVGPLSPDAAFQKENWKKYSIYVAMYHDQGLIPFKLVHGQNSGVHISAGLPFVRTSVDHGTAKDIFGKNKANPASMIEAIEACIHLTKSSIK